MQAAHRTAPEHLFSGHQIARRSQIATGKREREQIANVTAQQLAIQSATFALAVKNLVSCSADNQRSGF